LIGGFDYLRNLRSLKPDFVATVCVESTFGEDVKLSKSSTKISRILPRGVFYEGRIHEQPILALTIKDSSVVFAHDGYETTKNALKMGRNEALLRIELTDRPEDAYFNYQLGKDLSVQKRFPEALVYLERAILQCPLTSLWRYELVLRLLFAYKMVNQFDAALDLLSSEEDRFLDSPDFYFVSGDIFLDMSLSIPEHAETLMPMIESSFLTCRRIGERPDLPGTVHGVGSFLAAHNLYAFYSAIGETDKAADYLQLSLSENS
jgi:tetratricopeptide (TPR) repeat protein